MGYFDPDRAVINRLSPEIEGESSKGYPRNRINEISAVLKPKGPRSVQVSFEYITNTPEELRRAGSITSEKREGLFKLLKYSESFIFDKPGLERKTIVTKDGSVELEMACDTSNKGFVVVLRNKKSIQKITKNRKIMDWSQSAYSVKVRINCEEGFEIIRSGLPKVSYHAKQCACCKAYNTSYIKKENDGRLTEIELTSMPYHMEKMYKPWEGDASEEKMLDFETLSADSAQSEVLRNLEILIKKIEKHSEDTISDYGKKVINDNRNHHAEFQSDKKAIDAELNSARQGLKILKEDADALWAFIFLNKVMNSKSKKFRKWRPFQLVFILASIADYLNPARRKSATLLNFPTGMGKTEAFMGFSLWLAAYMRKRNLNYGTVAIIKYPRVMLSKQQAKRAIDLISHANKCLLDTELKKHPFSVGVLYSKEDTPNRILSNRFNYSSDTANIFDDGFLKVRKILDNRGKESRNPPKGKGGELGFEIDKCPLCGQKLQPIASEEDARILFLCGNKTCVYSSHKWNTDSVFKRREGELPLYISDEEVFRYAPTIIITTVYKMASFVLSGRWKTILGDQCPHGSDTKFGLYFYERDHESAKKITERQHYEWFSDEGIGDVPLKPPSLVIVDETHLISGSQASLLGPVETAFLQIFSGDGRYPLVVCSSATVNKTMIGNERTYQNQIAQLFGTDLDNVRLFPSSLDTYKSAEAPLQRVIVAFYPSVYQQIYAQEKVSSFLFHNIGKKENPYYKNPLFYFTSRAELSNIRRTMDDRVANVVGMNDLQEHFLEFSSDMEPGEVYSNLDMVDKSDKTEDWFISLATNMIANGIDSELFNIMVFHGLPNGVAEYIQARSRTARSEKNIALVILVLDRNNQREISFMESFSEWHTNYEYFYEENPINKYSEGVIKETIPRLLHLYAFWKADSPIKPIYSTVQMRDFVDKTLQSSPSSCSDALLNWLVEPKTEARLRSEISEKINEQLRGYLVHLKGRRGYNTIYSFDEEQKSDFNPYLPNISILQVSDMVRIKLSQEGVDMLEDAFKR
jgi:hypothetical protein